MSSISEAPAKRIENLDRARFRCIFPACGGVCCRNGRPSVTVEEAAHIEAARSRWLSLLRAAARSHIERRGWLTRRVKSGKPTVAVVDGWCVFFQAGCVLHRLGEDDGSAWTYKPLVCSVFPLERTASGQWYVRQWGVRGEVWDLFCLNPDRDSTPAAESLKNEIGLLDRFEAERGR